MKTLLITGTEAQIGKTTVITALLAYWQRYCSDRSIGVMKPVDLYTNAADDRDCDRLSHFGLNQTAAEITPIALQSADTTSLLPMIQQEKDLDLAKIWQQLQQLDRHLVVIETWGGLGAPLTTTMTWADLAWDWHLPAVLVAPVRPGAVAQIVANVALARQCRLNLKGILLNAVHPCHPNDWEAWVPIDLIQSLTSKPVLGCLPHLSQPDNPDQLIQAVSDWQLEQLFPELLSSL